MIAAILQIILILISLGHFLFGSGKLDLVFVFLFSLVSIVIIVIVFFVQRQHLRTRELLRQVKHKKGIGLTTVALVSLFVAVCLISLATMIINSCGLAIVSDFSSRLTMILNLIAGASYAGFFPLLVLASMAAGTNSFIEKMDRECPRPIFLDEVTLATVMYNALCDQIATEAQAQMSTSGQINATQTGLQRISAERTPSGGLRMIVRRSIEDLEWNDKSQSFESKKKLKYFVAETNEWGNLVSVREHDTRKPWEGRAK